MTAPYAPCPYSAVPDARGEPHPHNAGSYWVGRRRICAVCERVIDGGSREELDRAEAHAELVRIAGREYRRREQQEGASPSRRPRPVEPADTV